MTDEVRIPMDSFLDPNPADCRQIYKVPLFVQGLLSPEEKNMFEKHLRTCNACAKHLIDLKEMEDSAATAKLDENLAESVYDENLAQLKTAWKRSYPIEREKQPASFFHRMLRPIALTPSPALSSAFLLTVSVLLAFSTYYGIRVGNRLTRLEQALNAEKEKTRQLTDTLFASREAIDQREGIQKEKLAHVERALALEKQRSNELSTRLEESKKKMPAPAEWANLTSDPATTYLRGRATDPKLSHLIPSANRVLMLDAPKQPDRIEIKFTIQQPLFNLIIYTEGRKATSYAVELSQKNQLQWSDRINFPYTSARRMWAVQLQEGYFQNDGEYWLRILEGKEDTRKLLREYRLLVKKAK